MAAGAAPPSTGLLTSLERAPWGVATAAVLVVIPLVGAVSVCIAIRLERGMGAVRPVVADPRRTRPGNAGAPTAAAPPSPRRSGAGCPYRG